jgi:hypothetical protein
MKGVCWPSPPPSSRHLNAPVESLQISMNLYFSLNSWPCLTKELLTSQRIPEGTFFSTPTFGQKESARAARLRRRTATIASASWTLEMSQGSGRGYSLTQMTRWRQTGCFGVDLPTPGNLYEGNSSFRLSKGVLYQVG